VGELKHTLRFWSLKSLIVAIFVFEMQRNFCEALVGTPIRFEITQNRL
jgi:hypothetical protein